MSRKNQGATRCQKPKNAARTKIRHYRQLYSDRSDTIVFLSFTVTTLGHVNDDFVRLFFLYVYRETGILTGELPE